VDGTKNEIEVDEMFFTALRKFDRQIKYNNEKNRSIEFVEQIKTASKDVLIEVINLESENDLINALKEKKRCLLKTLPERQAIAYFYYKFLKLKKVDIAKEMGVTEGAVRKLIIKAEINLQKLETIFN